MSGSEFTKSTRFYSQLRKYGIFNIFFSVDFLVSVAVLVSLSVDKYYNLGIFRLADSNYLIAILAAAATLFSITLATLAIILSFSSSELWLS